MLFIRFFICFLLVHAEDNIGNQSIHPLCNCHSISLQSISGIFDDQSICYTYSIKHNSNNEQCQNNVVSAVFGICNGNDETQFNQQTLQESITSIHPDQPISISHSDEDSLLGLRLDINSEHEIKLCIKNINAEGLTSHNMQFVLNNNDIITCYNDITQDGLPCKSSTQIQENAEYVAKYIENNDGLGHQLQRIDIPHTDMNYENNAVETTDFGHIEEQNNIVIDNDHIVITRHSGLSAKELSKEKHTEQSEVRVTIKEYLTFALVVVAVIIGFNVLFCVAIAFRKSGIMGYVRYFNEIEDDEDEDVGVVSLYNIDDDNPEDYISDIAQLSHHIIRDIIASRNGYRESDNHISITDNENMFKE